MAIYLRVSSKTREARRKLESINSPNGEIKGKILLKNFLNVELKNQLSSKTSVQSIISYVENPNSKSNIVEFAKLLESNVNKNKFKEAVKCQAYSTGTKKDSLFRKMIYQGGNLNFNKMNKSKIKAFLLAKKDSDIDENEDLGANEKRENVVEEEDKKSRRMKNKDIVAKLKSGRLSNILKVFMALVLWSYVKLKSAEVVVDDQPFVDESEVKVQQKKVKVQQKKSREEMEIENDVLETVVSIEKICSFKTEGINLVRYEKNRLERFQSNFKNYKEENKLKEYLMKLINDKKGAAQYYKYKRDMEEVLPLIGAPKIKDLPEDAQAVARLSEEDLVKDLRSTYENEYKQIHNGNLHQKVEGFRKIIDCVKPQDKYVDLKLEDSFFDQKYEAPYRKINGSDMTDKWGTNIDTALPDKLAQGQWCKPQPALYSKIKEFLRKWFPDCKAVVGTFIEDGIEKNRYQAIPEYIMGSGDEDGGRFSGIMNSKQDTFTPRLFLKILYSFEKEANNLGIKPSDLSSGKKLEDAKKGRLKDFWDSTTASLNALSNGCSVQFQGAVDQMARLFDEYQTDNNETNENKLARKGLSFSDTRFCQLLRDNATSRAVASCERSSDDISGVDYARLLRSIFTPLVNASDSGYHSEPSLGSLGETYESLAVKWKNNVTSLDLMREVFNKAIPDIEREMYIDELRKKPIKYDKFISFARLGYKKSKNVCDNEMKKIYKLMEGRILEAERGECDPIEKKFLDMAEKMKKWIYEKGEFTMREFYLVVVSDDFFDLDFEEIGIYNKIFKRNTDITILYAMHLEDVGLIKISK